ncbi:hypothetical protein [Cupriavidus sp. D39]|uniref:hypothetical protein n=1 Tax=Cupriavidus sp. D39 TaxID=2997877 RepID=UPI00226F18C6|nr:hypothetical protein [Cupriavidus sp. D39]MCY0857558.1 hypothetical protein [Cupriavidus sp. D39]
MNNSDSKSKIEEPVDTNAKATIVAFTFQFERALFRLFSSHQANIRVGIETLDDVAELSLQHDGAVQATLEQDANTVQSDGHPFQDSSRKLWHTLRIWLSHVDKLRAEYQEVAFCMVTNATVPAAALVQRLALAMAPKEVTQCVELVRQHAIRLSKDAKAKAKADASIVARYADDDIAYLIRNLFLLHEGGAGSGVAPREATIQLFQLHSGIADQGVAIYQSILGAAVDKCQSAWRNQKTAWFSPRSSGTSCARK